MPERLTKGLKLLCVVLAAIVLSLLIQLAARKYPLADIRFPDLTAAPATIQASTASTTNRTDPPATNASAAMPPGAPPGMPMPGGISFPGMQGPPSTPLPPLVRARLDRIRDSEILGMIMRPLPMALLGIAGPDAFIRTDSGQTGLLREGETLGDVKLLRIGINRVLIEQGSQRKELNIFEGFGGESLLSK